VSCFIASSDVVAHRRLFTSAHAGWSGEAKLMFKCSSKVDEGSPILAYLKEIGWTIESRGKLFAQVNHSELLNELVGALSRIALIAFQGREV
jgi:hypothetical protein